MSKPVPMITLDRAIQMLPRYNVRSPRTWRVDGDRMQTNAQYLPDVVQKSIKKIMGKVDRLHFKPKIEDVDVSGNEIWVLHRQVATKNLLWLAKRDWTKLQHWPDSKLPVYLRWKGRLIIWNGTHRMTLGRLRGLKVRARVFDLNEFAEWSKTHPYGWDAKRWKVPGKTIKIFKHKKDADAYVRKLGKKAKARGNR